MDNETILITGITGTLGTAMTKRLLELNVGRIVGINRNETDRTNNEIKFKDKRIKRYTADICDTNAMEKIIRIEKPTIIILSAALKHINYAQENPTECYKINIVANQNLIELAIKHKVPKVVFLSTDKATNPTTIYGVSKLAIEQYIDCVNSEDTILLKTRYGNVLGSNGSVLQIWRQLKEQDRPLGVTNPNMTRFFMTISQAVELVLYAIEHGSNKDLWIYKNKSCTVQDLANCISDNQIVTGTEFIEKNDEALATVNELNHSQIHNGIYYQINKNIKSDIEYSEPLNSDNAERLTKEELLEMMSNV